MQIETQLTKSIHSRQFKIVDLIELTTLVAICAPIFTLQSSWFIETPFVAMLMIIHWSALHVYSMVIPWITSIWRLDTPDETPKKAWSYRSSWINMPLVFALATIVFLVGYLPLGVALSFGLTWLSLSIISLVDLVIIVKRIGLGIVECVVLCWSVINPLILFYLLLYTNFQNAWKLDLLINVIICSHVCCWYLGLKILWLHKKIDNAIPVESTLRFLCGNLSISIFVLLIVAFGRMP